MVGQWCGLTCPGRVMVVDGETVVTEGVATAGLEVVVTDRIVASVTAGLTLLAIGACDSPTIGEPNLEDRIVFTGRVTNEFDSGIRHALTWVHSREGDCGGPLPRSAAPFGTQSQHDGEYRLEVYWAVPELRCYTLTAVVGGRRPFDLNAWAKAGDSVQVNIVVPESWGR